MAHAKHKKIYLKIERFRMEVELEGSLMKPFSLTHIGQTNVCGSLIATVI